MLRLWLPPVELRIRLGSCYGKNEHKNEGKEPPSALKAGASQTNQNRESPGRESREDGTPGESGEGLPGSNREDGPGDSGDEPDGDGVAGDAIIEAVRRQANRIEVRLSRHINAGRVTDSSPGEGDINPPRSPDRAGGALRSGRPFRRGGGSDALG